MPNSATPAKLIGFDLISVNGGLKAIHKKQPDVSFIAVSRIGLMNKIRNWLEKNYDPVDGPVIATECCNPWAIKARIAFVTMPVTLIQRNGGQP